MNKHTSRVIVIIESTRTEEHSLIITPPLFLKEKNFCTFKQSK